MRKLEIGQSSSFSKTISESDVYGFAGIVGDFNPIHINAEAAKKCIFGQRVAHGMLVGSLISTVLGTKLPGEGTIYLEQQLNFRNPVYFGDTVTTIVTVNEIINPDKGIYKLDTKIANQNDDITHEGYAVVKYI
jgi:3-hydroxybutyryl-CoA dehydratase